MVVCPPSLLLAIWSALEHSNHPCQDVRCELWKSCTPWSSSLDPGRCPGAPETTPDTRVWAEYPSLTVSTLTSLAMYLTGQRPGPHTAAYVFPENMLIIPALSKWSIHGNSEKTVLEGILQNYCLGVQHMQQASRKLCATCSQMLPTTCMSQWESEAYLCLCAVWQKEEPLLLGCPFHTRKFCLLHATRAVLVFFSQGCCNTILPFFTSAPFSFVSRVLSQDGVIAVIRGVLDYVTKKWWIYAFI